MIASSVVPGGTPIRRPCGQTRPGDSGPPTFGPTRALDFELEMGFFVGPGNPLGEPIPIARAADHIFGLVLVNDWSARDLQREEMKMNLGPAKGKDFASSLGPWVVTPDELADRALGNGRYDLKMAARINGKQVSEGNFKDITFTFPQMIARASADVWLLPGDVIGSGTDRAGDPAYDH